MSLIKRSGYLHEKAETPIDLACAIALEQLKRELRTHKLTLKSALLLVTIEETVDGTNAVTAGEGFETNNEVVLELMAHLEAAATASGLNVEYQFPETRVG